MIIERNGQAMQTVTYFYHEKDSLLQLKFDWEGWKYAIKAKAAGFATTISLERSASLTFITSYTCIYM